jgi:L-ascorbate metabolism protein UlaG (beta-lactamase superfamily)
MSQSLLLGDTKRPAEFEEARILFVGAATAILRYGGFTILVDPRFVHHGDHVHLGYDLAESGPGASELANAVEQLPPIDFVLIPELQDGHSGRVDRELDRRLPVLTTCCAASTLRRKGFVSAKGLAMWETIPAARADATVRVTAVPAQRPASFESFLPDAMGSLLEFAGPDEAVRLRAFVSADSVAHGDLREKPRHHPGFDLALFPVCGRRVLGVLAPTEDGGATVRLVAARVVSPVPGDHGTAESPLEAFAAGVRRAGLDAHVEYVEPGAGYVFTPPALRAVRESTSRALAHGSGDALGTPSGDRPVAA